MDFKVVNEKAPHKYSVSGCIKQGYSQHVHIDLPANSMKSGVATIAPVDVRRPLVGEISMHARVLNTRKFFIVGDKKTSLLINIKTHRFSRVGRYSFCAEIRDSNDKYINILIEINITAGDEYRPKALSMPDRGLLKEADGLRPSVVNRGDKDGAVPVIMAAWKRVDNLSSTVEDLKRQTRKSRLVVWLNNPDLLTQAQAVAENEHDLHVTIYSSPNIGGFGRFYAARNESDEVVVMLDDDQRLADDSIERLLGVYHPNSIVGQWSFRFHHPNNYWLKDKPPKGVVEADYVGTGGMVMDTRVLHDKRLYEDIPDEYWFIEDLWLSWFAERYYDYRLYSLDAGVEIVKDGKDQMSSLVDKKTEFYKYLTKKGAKWSRRMKRLEKYDALTK